MKETVGCRLLWKIAIICGQVAFFWPFPPSFLTFPLFFALGFTISHSDKASGIIVGKKEETDTGGAILMGALFGVFALMGDYTDETSITLFLEDRKR